MDILIFLIILLIIMIPTAYAAIIGAPIALTGHSRIQEIIKAADAKQGDVFYELGTGTGRMITAFAKQTDNNVIGFELSPIFYFITLLNFKFHRIKNYRLYYKNFFNTNLKEADIIFCFLIPRSMEKLKNKFTEELRPGTKIISFVFPIQNWHPYAIIQGDNKPPVYFYKK